jgi:hypothetical protein
MLRRGLGGKAKRSLLEHRLTHGSAIDFDPIDSQHDGSPADTNKGDVNNIPLPGDRQ